MNTFLVLGSLFCYAVSGFFAYYTGKAELTRARAFRQPEVCGVWFLAFFMYVGMFARIGNAPLVALLGDMFAAAIVAMCTIPIPMIAHDIGLTRGQKARANREDS